MTHQLPVLQIDGAPWIINERLGEMRLSREPSNRRPLPELPRLKSQEPAFDHPASCCRFQPSTEKPFVATRAAIEEDGEVVIVACLSRLQRLATEHDGIDYLHVFTDGSKPEALWFIEDGDGGAITALLPSDY